MTSPHRYSDEPKPVKCTDCGLTIKRVFRSCSLKKARCLGCDAAFTRRRYFAQCGVTDQGKKPKKELDPKQRTLFNWRIVDE